MFRWVLLCPHFEESVSSLGFTGYFSTTGPFLDQSAEPMTFRHHTHPIPSPFSCLKCLTARTPVKPASSILFRLPFGSLKISAHGRDQLAPPPATSTNSKVCDQTTLCDEAPNLRVDGVLLPLALHRRVGREFVQLVGLGSKD